MKYLLLLLLLLPVTVAAKQAASDDAVCADMAAVYVSCFTSGSLGIQMVEAITFWPTGVLNERFAVLVCFDGYQNGLRSGPVLPQLLPAIKADYVRRCLQ